MTILHLIVIFGLVHTALLEPMGVCRKRRFTYLIADSEQCDKYYKCEHGELTEELCPDGLVYDRESQSCFMAQRINCKGRKLLQPPRGNDKCPRLNGRYPVGDQCHVYFECVDGTPQLVKCPENLVFDIKQAVCEFPDIANRTGCLAEDILGFRCPFGSNVNSEDLVLRFGDHERLPKPNDCRHFYMCLRSGQPRLGGCSLGLVFNPIRFVCDKPENVPGCENYYKI